MVAGNGVWSRSGEENLDAFNSLSSRGLFELRQHVVIFEASLL